MRFLIDAERGHDAVHVRDRRVDARPDPEVAAFAARERRATADPYVGLHWQPKDP
jgi:hypothetical protein